MQYFYSKKQYIVLLLFLFLTACGAANTPKGTYYERLHTSPQQYTQKSSSTTKPSPYTSSALDVSPAIKTTQKLPAHYKPYVVFGKTYYPIANAQGFKETGIASWYGHPFHGRKTSNGERYNMYARTAAHKTLPMGSIVRVTNLENNKVSVVRINDRGPFVGNRIIDLSRTSAEELGIVKNGTGRVHLEVIEAPTPLNFEHKKHYYVQIGAFSDEHTANSIQYSVIQMGMRSRLVKAENRNIWKVQVGPLKAMQETEKIQAILATDFPNNYVVVE